MSNTLTTSVRETRLRLLKERAEDALQKPQDEREQRNAVERMLVDANYAGVAILDWLEHFFEKRLAAKTAPEPIPSSDRRAVTNNVLVCKGCEKEFASQTALNGHGEKKCMRQKNRNTGHS